MNNNNHSSDGGFQKSDKSAKPVATKSITADELLGRIDSIDLPWTKDVFTELDPDEYEKIDEFAKTRGYRIDRISGTLMRRGWSVFKRQLLEELNDLVEEDPEVQS